MKLFLPTLIVPFLIASCTSDVISEQDINNVQITANNLQKNRVDPAYSSNPFDISGKLYQEIHDVSISQNPQTSINNIIEVVQNVAYHNTTYMQIEGDFNGLSEEEVRWIIDGSNNDAIINNLNVSVSAKAKLHEFMGLYDSLFFQEDSIAICEAIKSFEDTVINNNVYSLVDKQVILVTTSIARYQCCESGLRKRYNQQRLSLYGSMAGADYNIKKAVIMAVATEMSE